MQQTTGTVIAFDCGRGLASYIAKDSWPLDRQGRTVTPEGAPYDPVLMVVKNEHLEVRPGRAARRPPTPPPLPFRHNLPPRPKLAPAYVPGLLLCCCECVPAPWMIWRGT